MGCNPFYWVIILRKFLLLNILLKDLTDYYTTQQYSHLEFPFKFVDKMVRSIRDFLKIINL